MKKSINLLSHVEVKSETDLRYKKFLSIISIFALIATSLLVVILMIIQFQLKNTINILNNSNSDLETKIKEERSKEGALKVLKIKSTLLSQILSNKTNYYGLVDFLDTQIPVGVIYEEISIPDSKTMGFSGSAANAVVFGDYLQNLIDMEKGKKYFSSLKLNSFTNGKDGSYKFSFLANLIEVKK